jgi:hypothetical protein
MQLYTKLHEIEAGNHPPLFTLTLNYSLDSATNHQLFNLTNSTGRIQTFRADIHAIHNGMAAEQTIWIFQIIQTLTSCLIA